MNSVYEELCTLIELLPDDRSSNADNYSQTLEFLQLKADSSSKICQIIDFEKYAQVYFNAAAQAHFGTTNDELNKLGFQYMYKYLHPDNFNIIQSHISFFSNPENFDKILSHFYLVNTIYGWRWLYNCTKVAAFTKEGSAKYLFVSGSDITEILEGKGKYRKLKKNQTFIKEQGDNIEQLTQREKQILRYIVAENTSLEIADLLNISNTTVDTHRNNIIKKLKVKSSVGLVKYAIMFDLI